jgi:hypothetical protein
MLHELANKIFTKVSTSGQCECYRLPMTPEVDTFATTETQTGRLRILLRSSVADSATCSGTCGACCCYEKEDTG